MIDILQVNKYIIRVGLLLSLEVKIVDGVTNSNFRFSFSYIMIQVLIH